MAYMNSILNEFLLDSRDETRRKFFLTAFAFVLVRDAHKKHTYDNGQPSMIRNTFDVKSKSMLCASRQMSPFSIS